MRRTRSKAADVYKPYLKKYKITEKTRYNELLIVVDNQLYKKLEEDEDAVRRKVETLVNVVDGWNSGEIGRDLGPYDALAHEMGHNFGFDHDDDEVYFVDGGAAGSL
ncbi:unnamed protein product [Porites lobata]|uniref:Peptidase M12B domain-containing protein n=1 Tax=Porites lobata TaxID=104759 RepID=A0ABN8Q0C8_9CNID|nr:unnamed protein product [Porites lobata]